uniref:long-chain-fatty-acid--CoA ligase n=1 Tax=Ditylenchus dipsaci TaxID=166011 RepID=A0A915DQB0_9BILA
MRVLNRSEVVAQSFRKLEQPPSGRIYRYLLEKSPEWIIVEQATYAFNNVLVPLYDTIGIDASVGEERMLSKSKAHRVDEAEISEELKEQASQGGVHWVVRNNSWWTSTFSRRYVMDLVGRIKLMITGSAPVSDQVLTFVRCALGCFVIEGYGQTECVAACTVTIEGDAVPGHVVFFSLQFRQGFNVFRGYYNNDEQTKLVLDADGWLHTGDIGRWTERGTLKIVDRKKHIFKLAQGEYIAPEKVENVYLYSKYVAQCSRVVVPDAETEPELAELKLPTVQQIENHKAYRARQLDDEDESFVVAFKEPTILTNESGEIKVVTQFVMVFSTVRLLRRQAFWPVMQVDGTYKLMTLITLCW